MKRMIMPIMIFFLPIMIQVSFADNRYAVIKLEGTVNPIISDHIVSSIIRAGEQNHQFVVIQMDTPGGLMTSMQEIIKGIMSSKIPVVVYTYPRGAQAASAGGYIMLSANIAAMAPGTRIGAMHPVNILEQFSKKKDDDAKGDTGSIMNKKLLNDSIAYARSLAQKRNRNENWAVRAVRDAISSTYAEALRENVIDIIAEDMPDLLNKLHNRTVLINGNIITLNTRGAVPVEYAMDWKQRFLNFVADPQVVFFLFIITIIGIGMEFKSPGMILPGTVGAISFFIFLMAIRIIPINFAGLALIVLAIVLFVLELKITSYGLLTTGGILSFLVGSMILFDSPLPGFRVPITTILAMVLCILAFVFIVVRAVIKVHQNKVVTGSEGMLGDIGSAIDDFDGTGKVSVHGEIWNARSDENIRKHDSVEVTGITGMILHVKKNTSSRE
ncbi:MAG TPA: nodulation protein NfeD [Spirochaetota bacterium]|nr:nodulation protein NfeD [Spirochaetota bacterium]